MPVTPTYPGVYIEEIPSGVRTITGVATSIAAFAGWAAKGAGDRATRVLSWSDFERNFGGLDARSLLGYSLNQFFSNGGQDAYVIRLTADDADIATVALGGVLTVNAKNPGEWANDYGVRIKPRSDDATRFLLTVVYVDPDTSQESVIESFENLSMDEEDSRFVETVVLTGSVIISVDATGSSPPPDTSDTSNPPDMLTGGDDGTVLEPDDSAFESKLLPLDGVSGLYLLDRIDLFNIVCVPGETNATMISSLEKFCRDRRSFLVADCQQADDFSSLQSGPNSTITGNDGMNAAFYFPWIVAPDPLDEYRSTDFPPCGFVAGLYAKTDSLRGVWKAPAGTEVSLTGASGTGVVMTDKENGVLNTQGINCIRTFPVYGTVLWGARTLHGNDERGSEWKYIPVRRIALFLEESLYRGTQWVVFEPNDEPLWAQIRLNVGAFMHSLFRQGAFQGKTPAEAYFVKCDKESTTQDDINKGIVNIVVGFAPLKPAEFVIIRIQQMAGEIQS